MSPVLRVLLLVLLLTGLTALAMLVTRDNEAATTAARWSDSGQCRTCHAEVWEEWQGSHHQIAYLNPRVRQLSDDFRNKECQACHLPRPVAVTGYAQRTLPRITRPDQGVDCLTCHLGARGEILARNARPDVPCAPIASAEVVSVELCESCHNQHKTTDQWRATGFAMPTQLATCNACHMPSVDRGGRKGRSHAFPGAHDIDMLRAAGLFTATAEDGALVVSLKNVGAGHNFPTEERHRAVDIVVRFVLGDGSSTGWQRVHRCRQPYRDETGPDTQLPYDQSVTVRVPTPDGAVRAQARLWYRLQPYIDDDHEDSTLLEEREVVLR